MHIDMFNQNNCRNCPIQGQLEISAHSAGGHDTNSMWIAGDGIFFVDRNFERKAPPSPVDEDDEMDARYTNIYTLLLSLLLMHCVVLCNYIIDMNASNDVRVAKMLMNYKSNILIHLLHSINQSLG
jgi:hypothetical protein